MAAKNLRYTTESTLVTCMRLARVSAYTLDVAADVNRHCAPKYYTKKDNGLSMPWFGYVWCNPPFDKLRPWFRRAWHEWETRRYVHPRNRLRHISMLIPANRTEQPFWHKYVEPYLNGVRSDFRVHFLKGRQSFGNQFNVSGVGAGSPPWGVVLLVWDRDC